MNFEIILLRFEFLARLFQAWLVLALVSLVTAIVRARSRSSVMAGTGSISAAVSRGPMSFHDREPAAEGSASISHQRSRYMQ
jgi:hypothetical protein